MAGLAGLVVVLWAPLWTGERTFILQDVAAYFHPMKDALARAVKAGEWPWWNPWIRNGLPFFANPQVGLFYPPSVLFYVLPTTALAFNWVTILHLALLATGIHAWLRRTGRSSEAAAFAAVAVAFGGTAVSLTTYLNNLQAVAWIGWTWWAWAGWTRDRSPRWLALTALGFALQFLAGEPQVAVLTAVLALAMAWTWPGEEGRHGRRRWIDPALALAGAAALAMLVTAIQLVPTVELFLRSRRSAGMIPAEVLSWSLSPLQLANLAVPRDFTGPEGLFGLARVPVPTLPWLYTSYVGVVTLALAAAAPGRRERRATAFWAAVAVVGATLALGRHNPLVAAAVERGAWIGLFRYPEKMLLLPAVAVPVLAAHGVDALGERAARRRAVAVAAALAGLGLAGWLLVDAGTIRALAAGWDVDGLRPVDPASAAAGVRDGLLHVTVFAVLAAVAAASARALRGPVPSLLLTALLALDLAVNLDAAPLAPAAVYEEMPAVLEPLPVDRLRVDTRVRTMPLGEAVDTWFTVPGITLATAQLFLLETMGPNTSMLHGILAQDGAEAFRPLADDTQVEILARLPVRFQVRYLRLMGVGYLYENALDAPGLERMSRERIFGLYPYRVVDPLPRAYLVGRAVVEPDTVAVLNRFVAGGEDPRRIAYVADGPGLDGPAEPVDGTIRWLPGSNHVVRLDVETPVRALLVLTDNAYPGWTVEVDGHRARLERVNWRFRGVVLDPGRHRVRFAYRPRGIAAGAAASALGLLVVVGLLVRGGGRRRRGA